MNSEVEMDSRYMLHGGKGPQLSLASVVKARVSPIDPGNPFGRIQRAELILLGRLIPFNGASQASSELGGLGGWRLGNELVDTSPFEWDVLFDEDAEARFDPRKAFFLPITIGLRTSRRIAALALLKVDDVDSEQHERVGFAHLDAENPEKRLAEFEEREVVII